MCGIVGYVGAWNAAPVLLSGLSRLEYRGYDSAGIAVSDLRDGENRIEILKAKGRLQALKEMTDNGKAVSGTCGIGHTRWATHGEPSVANAHPHCSKDKRIVVVHNGIIENYKELKEYLQKKGFVFLSETDTEVVAHLLDYYYKGNPLEAIARALGRIRGSYALGILFKDQPGKIYAVRKDSPLIIGRSENGNFIASDVPAILKYTKNVCYISDMEIAELTKDTITFYDVDQEVLEKEFRTVEWDAKSAEKGGFEHFMLKEIYEQPKAIKDTMRGRLAENGTEINFTELGWTPEDFTGISKIFIVACGTAYHAGIVGKYYLENLARIPVEVDIASEFRYRNPLVDANCLTIVISQSGETIDTLAALKEAKRLGSRTLAVTNVVGSSIAREADQVVYTYAGPEIAVASTKAYTTQLLVMLMLAVYVGRLRGTLDANKADALAKGLHKVPEQLHNMLENVDQIKVFARHYGSSLDAFFLGRSLDYAVALEGALKLKEISYIHAEAYAAGELKHGTLALIVEGVPVIVLATQEDVYDKTVSNLQEVKAREAMVIAIALEGDDSIAKYADHVIYIPRADKELAPILAVLPLQLLAYYAALTRGCDVDKPRNLAKSVTVE